MSYLNNFYNHLQKYGVSKDYQLKLMYLSLGGDDLFKDYPYLGSYAKKLSVPIRESTAIKNLSLNGISQPLFGGVADFVNKQNYPIAFWVDRKLQIYNLFDDSIALNVDTEGQVLNTDGNGKIELALIDDQNITIGKFTITGVAIVGMDAVVYSSDGTGKPQEITVKFGYKDASYAPLENPQNYDYASALGAADNGVNRGPDDNWYNSNVVSQKPVKENKPALSNFQKIIKGINDTTHALQAVGTAAKSIRGAGRAIRGR